MTNAIAPIILFSLLYSSLTASTGCNRFGAGMIRHQAIDGNFDGAVVYVGNETLPAPVYDCTQKPAKKVDSKDLEEKVNRNQEKVEETTKLTEQETPPKSYICVPDKSYDNPSLSQGDRIELVLEGYRTGIARREKDHSVEFTVDGNNITATRKLEEEGPLIRIRTLARFTLVDALAEPFRAGIAGGIGFQTDVAIYTSQYLPEIQGEGFKVKSGNFRIFDVEPVNAGVVIPFVLQIAIARFRWEIGPEAYIRNGWHLQMMVRAMYGN